METMSSLQDPDHVWINSIYVEALKEKEWFERIQGNYYSDIQHLRPYSVAYRKWFIEQLVTQYFIRHEIIKLLFHRIVA